MSERLPEVALAAGSLCIADVHLDGTDAAAVGPFARWAIGLRDVPVLAILGDLFDVWVGPAQAELPGAAVALASLAGLRARGTRICVVPGNRDFLLGRPFELLTRAEVFADGFVATIERRGGPALRALCVHGDTLCTRDRGYQRLRAVLRSGAVTAVAPRLPRSLGLALARRLRRASTRALATKPPDEKSIQPDAVVAAARMHAAELVLCGHAHAFRNERLEVGVRWIVLDAFGGERDAVEIAEDGSIRIRSAQRG